MKPPSVVLPKELFPFVKNLTFSLVDHAAIAKGVAEVLGFPANVVINLASVFVWVKYNPLALACKGL